MTRTCGWVAGVLCLLAVGTGEARAQGQGRIFYGLATASLGSTFGGDNDVNDPGFPYGRTRYHRGLRNVSAGMDVAREMFPDAKQITVMGHSAGGVGATAFAPFLARFAFGNNTKLTVFNDAHQIGVMTPQRNIHKTHEEQPMTEVAIRSNLREDLYVILAGLGDDGTANFRVIVNPLMMWMWIGSVVLTLGTLIAFWPERGEALRTRARYVVETP